MCASKSRIAELQAQLQNQFRYKGTTWIPEYPRILSVPPIIPSEAASSWIWRMASQTRLPIQVILKSWELSIPSFWLDAGVGNLDIEALARSTMQSVESLEHLRWPFLSTLADPEFACLTADPLHRRPIYRYCEVCLRRDPIPFVRQVWRLSCSYVCEEHGTILRDSCPRCSSRLDLSRDDIPNHDSVHSTEASVRYCQHCRGDLTDTPSNFLPDSLLLPVFEKQVEIMSLIFDSVPNDEESECAGCEAGTLRTSQNGVVDVTNIENILKLFGSAIKPAMKLWVNEVSKGNPCELLRTRLVKIGYSNVRGEKIEILIGLNGSAIFGKQGSDIALHTMACQNLIGGTYWWGDLRSPKIVDGICDYEQSRINSALHWINSRGRRKGDKSICSRQSSK